MNFSVFKFFLVCLFFITKGEASECSLVTEKTPPPPQVSKIEYLVLEAEFADPLRLQAFQGMDLMADEDFSSERLLVSAGGLHNVAIFDLDLNLIHLQRAPDAINEPNRSGDIVSLGEGTFSLITFDNPYVTTFGLSGNVISKFNKNTALNQFDQKLIKVPVGLHKDDLGNLIFVDRGNSRIVVSNIGGNYKKVIESTEFIGPYDVRFIENCILVSDREGKKIHVLFEDGSYSHRLDLRLADNKKNDDIDTRLNYNQHIYFAGDGLLYLVDTGSRRILVIHPTGIIASELRFDDLGVIRAVVVDENGYLYAGGFNKNAKLMKYPGTEARIFKFKRQ